MALMFLLLWIAFAAWRAWTDARSLPRRPSGPVRQLFLTRAVAAGIAVLGGAFAPTWVLLWRHLGIENPPHTDDNPLGIPPGLLLPVIGAILAGLAGGIGALAATHLIHRRRIFSSLAPYAPADRFR